MRLGGGMRSTESPSSNYTVPAHVDKTVIQNCTITSHYGFVSIVI